MNQQAERRVGTVIGGKWRVDGLLGSGSMAAVYAVTHRNGARAALKILHPTLCTDPAVCERFLGEGYLANSVKHSGIVRVLDDGVTDDGCVFLTMDLLEGDTLEALRQNRGNKIPVIEALDLGDKLMDVLSAVHVAGIIHRDLKPQNVFVCDDGVLKLLDFGVARVFDRTAQSKLSMFGLVLGTPSFMSPEQALGSRDKVDHRSDIWSFGATMFTALTGETVHLGANVQAKLLAAATVKARSIAMVMPSLPPGISAVIDQALRFKKEDRWQSTDAMRRAFREARDAAGLGSMVDPRRHHGTPLDSDDATHVDPGNRPSFRAPSTTTRTIPISEPPEGPSGTFIGIGGADGKLGALLGNDGSVPPPGVASMTPHVGGSFRPPMTSSPPPLPSRARAASQPDREIFTRPAPPSSGRGLGGNSSTPPPLPAAVMRRLPTPDPHRISRPDGQEGSIPAYGNTLNFGAEESLSDIDPRAVGRRRKGSVGVWLLAVLLAASAFGGITFFAVKRGPLSVDPNNGSALPDPGSTVAPLQTDRTTSADGVVPTVAPAVMTQPTSDPYVTKDAGIAAQTAPPPPTLAPPAPPPPPRPTSTWRPPSSHGPKPGRPPASADAPPTSEPPRPPPPGLAPDPFGTPE